MGDTVEIMETRPLSKTKNWRLVRIVTKAPRRRCPTQSRAARGVTEAPDSSEGSDGDA